MFSDKTLSINQMAKDMGVSPHKVRETLGYLQQAGHLSRNLNDGNEDDMCFVLLQDPNAEQTITELQKKGVQL